MKPRRTRGAVSDRRGADAYAALDGYRGLARRFRLGETLTRAELDRLRDFAIEHGNHLLAQRCQEEADRG